MFYEGYTFQLYHFCRERYTKKRKEIRIYDKNTFHLPRHSSFMIMHTFVDWGNTGQNMAESIGNTTVSTTKAHGRNRDKGKGVGRNS